MRRRDDLEEKNVVKAFVSEDEMEEFREMEALLSSIRPDFGEEWKGDLFRTIIKEQKQTGFYWRSMIAASLLIAAVSFSLLVFNSGFNEAGRPEKAVSAELVSDLVLSFDGKLETDLNDVMSAAEEKYRSQNSDVESYVEELIGANDENDLS